MRNLFALSFFFFSLFAAKSQTQDTFNVKAKILRLDTVGDYFVLHVKKADEKEILILSAFNKSDKVVANVRTIFDTKIGRWYDFRLTYMSTIVMPGGKEVHINLRGFNYNDKVLLKPGEMPYKLISMYRIRIHNR